MGERTVMLHRNLRGDKNPGSTNKYTKFGQLIIRKIIKIIATRCHILRINAPNSIPSVCRSSSVRSCQTIRDGRTNAVRPSVRLLDGIWAIMTQVTVHAGHTA